MKEVFPVIRLHSNIPLQGFIPAHTDAIIGGALAQAGIIMLRRNVLGIYLREEQNNKAVKQVREWINIMFGQMDFAPILPLSALEGKGIKDLLNTTINMYDQLTRKIGTASLNNALQDWLERYPPPASKTAHFKIRYMTQASTNPVSFVIFATRPEVVPEPYVTYLKNRIRQDLGFDNIPIQVEFKGSRQKWEEREK